MAPLQYLHVKLLFTSLSPAVPNSSMGFNYWTSATTPALADVSDLATFVAASFGLIPAGGTKMPADYIAGVMARGSGKILIDVYDVTGVLAGSRMGSPVLVSSATLGGTPVNGPVPQEAAAVVTLQAPYGSDVEFGPGTRPRARDRGRLYFGPLDSGALSVEATTNRTLLLPAMRTNLVQWIKAINIHTTAPNTCTYDLAVWSRRGAQMKSLSSCWVDDNPDTQRRRGGKPVAKTQIALP